MMCVDPTIIVPSVSLSFETKRLEQLAIYQQHPLVHTVCYDPNTALVGVRRLGINQQIAMNFFNKSEMQKMAYGIAFVGRTDTEAQARSTQIIQKFYRRRHRWFCGYGDCMVQSLWGGCRLRDTRINIKNCLIHWLTSMRCDATQCDDETVDQCALYLPRNCSRRLFSNSKLCLSCVRETYHPFLKRE